MTSRRKTAKQYAVTSAAIETSQAVHLATHPFDEEARRMDRKWGVDRLTSLVPPDMAAKYGKAFDAMNAAIRDEDAAAVAMHVANLIRGMRAMDAAAEAAGHAKADPSAYIECQADNGPKFAILTDERFWPAVKEARPDLQTVSLREVALALDYRAHALVREAARAFPGAEMEIKPPRSKTHDDPIPFP